MTAILDPKCLITDVPDFPKKGVVFKDITPLLADAKAFAFTIDQMTEPFVGKGITIVAGIESRGFLLATPKRYRLGAGVVPIREKGKLPRRVHSASYDLEYGRTPSGPMSTRSSRARGAARRRRVGDGDSESPAVARQDRGSVRAVF